MVYFLSFYTYISFSILNWQIRTKEPLHGAVSKVIIIKWVEKARPEHLDMWTNERLWSVSCVSSLQWLHWQRASIPCICLGIYTWYMISILLIIIMCDMIYRYLLNTRAIWYITLSHRSSEYRTSYTDFSALYIYEMIDQSCYMILTQLEVEKAGQVRRAHLKKGISTTGRIESMYILQVQYILT